MIHYDLQQGSPEWLECRRGVITGSKFKDAREKLKNGKPSSKAVLYAQNLARERCHGVAPAIYQNAAMQYGAEQEAFARRAYEVQTRSLVEPVGFFKTEDGIFGLSPDGLIDDDGVLEIKTMVSSDTLFTAVADGDIGEYIDQVNGYLWLLRRQWVDLVLWAPDMETLGLKMVIRRITRNEEDIQALQDDLMAFAVMVIEYETKLHKAANQQKEAA